MKSETKPNITVEDIGKTFYTSDGTDVWKLIDFKPEPQVEMLRMLTGETLKGNLAEFKDFIRLLPETAPVKPRKTRSDSGSHKKQTAEEFDFQGTPSEQPLTITVLPINPKTTSASNNPVGTVPEPTKSKAKMPGGLPDPLVDLVIRSATKDNPAYTIKLGFFTAHRETLKECVIGIGAAMSWGIDEESILEKIKSFPDSPNRTDLINILEGGKE